MTSVRQTGWTMFQNQDVMISVVDSVLITLFSWSVYQICYPCFIDFKQSTLQLYTLFILAATYLKHPFPSWISCDMWNVLCFLFAYQLLRGLFKVWMSNWIQSSNCWTYNHVVDLMECVIIATQAWHAHNQRKAIYRYVRRYLDIRVWEIHEITSHELCWWSFCLCWLRRQSSPACSQFYCM